MKSSRITYIKNILLPRDDYGGADLFIQADRIFRY